MNKRILWTAIAVAMILANVSVVSASPISDARKEKKATEKKLNDLNESIENIEEEKELLEEEAVIYEQELVDILVTIQVVNGDIKSKEEEISKAQAEYEASLAKQEAQKLAMNKRIKYMYEKGDTSYMLTLLEARKFADAVNKSTYSEKLYAYDRYQLYLYEQTKLEVLENKKILEEDLEELEEIKEDATYQEAELQRLIDEYSRTIENFEEELSSAKKKAEEFKNQIQKQSDSIKAMEEEERRKIEEENRRKAEEAARKKAEEAARKKVLEEEEQRKREEAEREASESESSDESSDNSDDSTEVNMSSSEKNQEKSESTAETSSSTTENTAESTSSGSSLGQQIASFACKFIGNPYVAGGTSLTNGADCSGFTSAVYDNFGISLPRTSGSQAMCGRAVSYAEAQPGDIIYYGGHVGIYIGNGQIVHASTQATGIKISNALYRSIISVRRIV